MAFDENHKEYDNNTYSLKYITICKTIESPENKVAAENVCFLFYRHPNRLETVGV